MNKKFNAEKAGLYLSLVKDIYSKNNDSVEGLSIEEYEILYKAMEYYRGYLLEELNTIEPFYEAFKRAANNYRDSVHLEKLVHEQGMN